MTYKLDPKIVADLDEVARSIAKTVAGMHEGRKTWNKACGQWLVYGFEAQIGFGKAVQLEAVVERAWMDRDPIDLAVSRLLCKWAIDKAKAAEGRV